MEKIYVQAHEEALEKRDIDNFVSFTAISVSAGRLAEGMREHPLFRDPLIAEMLGSSEGILHGYRTLQNILYVCRKIRCRCVLVLLMVSKRSGSACSHFKSNLDLARFFGAAIQAAAKHFRELVLKQEEENPGTHVVNMVVQRTNYLDDKLMGALAAMPVNDATPVKRQVSH